MIEPGHPDTLGSTSDSDGVNFAIWSADAEQVELCLFDSNGRENQRHILPGHTGEIWHGFLPGCKPGQQYGYRIYGRYAPDEGLRFNPNKLLIDPYARELSGQFHWKPAVYDFIRDGHSFKFSEIDSAACIPKCVVVGKDDVRRHKSPKVPWSDTIIYEANVRGYTMRHPRIPEARRGLFSGMKHAEVLSYLKSLGVTTIELMPVHEFIDEAALTARGLRNFWGYNSINFFTPASRYSAGNARREFIEMTNAIHDAGFEVVLDVAYNHTGESDRYGPTVSFRGIDNAGYYRTISDAPGDYVNDTGCGNTINADHPRVQELVLDSLRYWAQEMGADGFRFDLATVTARTSDGFTSDHPLLKKIESDDDLKHLKFIAEPWDIGPDGYQLGQFPALWSEWNDKYRDSVRRFWRGDKGESAEFARRLHGSADLFESGGKQPAATINFVSAHDGFTLADVVSFENRHNVANGEDNRDGHSHNFSCNYGVEGETDNPEIVAMRRRQRLNMLATLLLSQGTPMLLAGDEFGNSQAGNNNAYAQDNETGWIDWSGLESDPGFQEAIRELIALRQAVPVLRSKTYLHDNAEIQWWHPAGRLMQAEDWQTTTAFAVVPGTPVNAAGGMARLALLLNSTRDTIDFILPDPGENAEWILRWGEVEEYEPPLERSCRIQGPGLAVLATADQGSQ